MSYFISKQISDSADRCYSQTVEKILKLLINISANNEEVKKELLENIVAVPKILWSYNSYFFNLLLVNILEDYPTDLNTTEEEENIVIEIAKHFASQINKGFKSNGFRIDVGQFSVLKHIVAIKWLDKDVFLKTLLSSNEMIEFLDLGIMTINYFGGKKNEEYDKLLVILRRNM